MQLWLHSGGGCGDSDGDSNDGCSNISDDCSDCEVIIDEDLTQQSKQFKATGTTTDQIDCNRAHNAKEVQEQQSTKADQGQTYMKHPSSPECSKSRRSSF
ncbi:unnamed protein product [Camellia sinensis]